MLEGLASWLPDSVRDNDTFTVVADDNVPYNKAVLVSGYFGKTLANEYDDKVRAIRMSLAEAYWGKPTFGPYPRCELCGADDGRCFEEDVWLCWGCRYVLHPPEPEYCECCGRPLED